MHEPYRILFSWQGAKIDFGMKCTIGDVTNTRYVAQCLTNASFYILGFSTDASVHMAFEA